MPSLRQLFLSHVAQTSELPMMLEIDRAKGVFIYDKAGKKYFDMNSGISVSALGHGHPNVLKAIREQSERHMHTMVYGEHIQQPQVEYATKLTSLLAEKLNAVYFVNSGTEAVEVAMKLAKRYTGKYEIVSCANAYHGSTQGAESLRSDLDFTRAFAPSIPGIRHIEFNNFEALTKITEQTAAVILEPIQAEAGVITPDPNYLKEIRKQCNEVGALFILDEIQTGFGRTGSLFAHQHFDVVPDVLLIAKSMGGGMPIGAVVSDIEIFKSFTSSPALGHITTFGGHPVSCAASLAFLNTLLEEKIIEQIDSKNKLISELLNHEIIKEIRSKGLMMAVELTKRKYLKHVVGKSLELGLIVDWFLFNNRSFRLYPPLIINEEEIKEACNILLRAMDFARDKYNN